MSERDNIIAVESFIDDACVLSPTTYQYYKNLENRKIILSDEIMQDVVENVILPLMQMDDSSGEPVELIMSTPGGSMFDSMILCDIIDRIKVPLTITILGYAHSMGLLIAMAGRNNPLVKKRCYPHSIGLLHKGSTALEGEMNMVADTYKFQIKFEEKIKNYVLSHSVIDENEYEKMEKCQWYFTAEDMLEKGIVDEIIGYGK